MVLPSSGWISAWEINVELGRAGNAPFSMNDPAVRALAGKPSGAIWMSDFYGKSNSIREPASGEHFSLFTTQWYDGGGYAGIYWNGASIAQGGHLSGQTQVTVGSWTYYRGSYRGDASGANDYGIYRIGRY